MQDATHDGENGHEFPQKPGCGARIIVSKDRLANETDSKFVFFTDASEAQSIAQSAIRQVAIERLRGELGREPDEHEIEARAADIIESIGRDFRRFL